MAWIDNLFRMMSEKKASDLHMTSEHQPMIRESGDMMVLDGVPKLSKDQVKQILMEIAPDRSKKQFEACPCSSRPPANARNSAS